MDMIGAQVKEMYSNYPSIMLDLCDFYLRAGLVASISPLLLLLARGMAMHFLISLKPVIVL
jgi:hypothetical protein